MQFKIDEFFLKRLDKKLWQYRDCKPARVELAVLDAYKDEGWSGYFTEHFDYFQTLIFMMCWPDHRKIGAAKNRGMTTVDKLFYNASDGFLVDDYRPLFSWEDLLDNASNFDESEIPLILDTWQSKKRLIAEFIGRAYLTGRHASELDANELLSFYMAVGGKEFFLEFIKLRHPYEFQKLQYRARVLIEEVRASVDRESRPNLLDVCMDFYEILGISGGKATDREHIERFSIKALEQGPKDLASKASSLAREVHHYRLSQAPSGISALAHLDLALWRDGEFMTVEVKAPNDRLSRHQIAQLELDRQEGRDSRLANVFEE